MALTIREVARTGRSEVVDPRVRRYVERSVSPLLGPIRTLRVLNFDHRNPALVAVLPELVEVHRRAGVSRPDYHVGGFGLTFHESLMRAVGESAERAAHFLYHVSVNDSLERHSEDELRAAGTPHVAIRDFGFFSENQYRQPVCPVKPLSSSTPIRWIPLLDIRTGTRTLLPAQAVLAGFASADEPRVFVGITTGSAAHVDHPRALLGAMLELLQVDVTVGHWYSVSTAPRLVMSAESTPRFFRMWQRHARHLERSGSTCEFYWLRQPESIPVYVVACVIRRKDSFPALMIGHGVSPDLERAMYRALYEAVPISMVALIQVLRQMFAEPGGNGNGAVPEPRARNVRSLFHKLPIDQVTDLEAAVAYYALPENAAPLFPKRFDPRATVTGDEIEREVPPVWRDAPPEEVSREMLSAIGRHHRAYAMELTPSDTRELGLRVVRIYSPDLMSLPLPSFPEARHPRWAAYGGFRSAEPHPYP